MITSTPASPTACSSLLATVRRVTSPSRSRGKRRWRRSSRAWFAGRPRSRPVTTRTWPRERPRRAADRRGGAAPRHPEPFEGRRRGAFLEGFSLHAGVRIHARDRDGRERLCRYIVSAAPTPSGGRDPREARCRAWVSVRRMAPGGGEILQRIRQPEVNGAARRERPRGLEFIEQARRQLVHRREELGTLPLVA